MNKVLRRPAHWAASACLAVLAAASGTTPVAAGLYNWKTSKVVQLTEKNFQSLVLDSKETWYVLVCIYCFRSPFFGPGGVCLSGVSPNNVPALKALSGWCSLDCS